MTGNDTQEEQTESQSTIKSISNTFRIVEAMTELEEPRITELADQTGLTKSTVHKHLATLVNEGYVVKDEEKYQLGSRFLDIGGHVREDVYNTGNIKKRIKHLADESDLVAHFAVEEHGQAIVLYREGGQQDLPTRSRIGKRMPMHQTAYGKSILAHLPEDRIEEIIENHGFSIATEKTVIDREELYEELAEVREQGYAINDEESTKGLKAIGAPVLLNGETVFGACSIAGPEMRIDEEHVNLLRKVTKQLELEIAYS